MVPTHLSLLHYQIETQYNDGWAILIILDM